MTRCPGRVDAAKMAGSYPSVDEPPRPESEWVTPEWSEWSMLCPFGGSLWLMYCSGSVNGHAPPHIQAAKARRRWNSVPHYKTESLGKAEGKTGNHHTPFTVCWLHFLIGLRWWLVKLSLTALWKIQIVSTIKKQKAAASVRRWTHENNTENCFLCDSMNSQYSTAGWNWHKTLKPQQRSATLPPATRSICCYTCKNTKSNQSAFVHDKQKQPNSRSGSNWPSCRLPSHFRFRIISADYSFKKKKKKGAFKHVRISGTLPAEVYWGIQTQTPDKAS